MRRFWILMAICLGVPAAGAAQTCTPTFIFGNTPYSDGHTGGTPTPADANTQVAADTNASHVFSPILVPAGKVLVLRTVSLSTDYGGAASYMVEHLVTVPLGYHYHAIGRTEKASGTPVLAMSASDLRADPFLPGERLGFRTNGPGPIFGMWSGFLYDLSCLPRVLGMAEATASGGGPSTPPPDYSALIQAAQQAATALQTLAQSAP